MYDFLSVKACHARRFFGFSEAEANGKVLSAGLTGVQKGGTGVPWLWGLFAWTITACSAPPPESFVGEACATEADCWSGFCLQEQTDDSGRAWTKGYCSAFCADEPCVAGTCVMLADGASYCLSACGSDSDCRAGYVCVESIQACLPDCREGWSCGDALECDDESGACVPRSDDFANTQGSLPVGSACSLNAECASGLCIPESLDDESTGWPLGYCTAACDTESCPSGATCLRLADGSSYCTAECEQPGDCREGYVCAPNSGCLPDCRGGWSCGDTFSCNQDTGLCVSPYDAVQDTPQSSDPPGPVGAPCALNAQCTTGLCEPEELDGASTGWPLGYCTQACDTESCPSDSDCVHFSDGSSFCAARCQQSEDCRKNYVCIRAILACLPDCRSGWSCGSELKCNASTGMCDPV